MTSISQDFSKVWMNFGWPSMYVLGTIRVPSAPPSQSENVVKFPEMIRLCPRKADTLCPFFTGMKFLSVCNTFVA